MLILACRGSTLMAMRQRLAEILPLLACPQHAHSNVHLNVGVRTVVRVVVHTVSRLDIHPSPLPTGLLV